MRFLFRKLGCFLPLIMLVVIVGGFVLVVTAGPGPNVRPANAEVFSFRREGPRVTEDERLGSLFRGGLSVSREQIADAACINVVDWLRDRSLSTSIVIATMPRLVRAAEMVAAGDVSASTAAAEEARFWGGTVPGGVKPTVAESERYAELIEQAPSPAAEQRFVAYIVTKTLTSQLVTVVDTEDLDLPDLGGIENRVPKLAVYLTGRGEASVDSEVCVRPQ